MSDCDLCKPIKEKGKNCLCDMHLNWVLKENRKQGALEELKLLRYNLNGLWETEVFERELIEKLEKIYNKRIKELEGEGVKE